MIRCKAQGTPVPQISWIHNGKPIEQAEPNPRRQVTADTIIISDLTKKDTGNYGCNATNSVGYVYKDIYINVQCEYLYIFLFILVWVVLAFLWLEPCISYFQYYNVKYDKNVRNKINIPFITLKKSVLFGPSQIPIESKVAKSSRPPFLQNKKKFIWRYWLRHLPKTCNRNINYCHSILTNLFWQLYSFFII